MQQLRLFFIFTIVWTYSDCCKLVFKGISIFLRVSHIRETGENTVLQWSAIF